MSLEHVLWAMDAEQSGALDPIARLVLVGLANVADGAGRARIDTPRLARMVAVSERTVAKHLRTLRADGIVRGEPGTRDVVVIERGARRPPLGTCPHCHELFRDEHTCRSSRLAQRDAVVARRASPLPMPAALPARCDVHGIARNRAGVCPGCRADELAAPTTPTDPIERPAS